MKTLQRRTRGGFIIFFGTRSMISNDSSAAPVQTVCPKCNCNSTLVPKQFRRWFTLFFIPVFPISGAQSFCQCSTCGSQFMINPNELKNRMARNEQQQTQDAIALYNSLRTSPANSITLNDLMLKYAGMKEFDQAISAASEFTQALHSSEQCMTTLGRLYLAKNEFESALQWFAAAIARNPQLGEAHYYAAVTHMMRKPPDFQAAVASARAARSAGFPNSDAILRDAEAKARGAQPA